MRTLPRVRPFAAALAAAVLLLPAAHSSAGTIGSPQAFSIFYPTGTGRMDSGMGGGILDDNSPIMWAGARMHRTYQLAGQLEHIRALQAKIEAEAYQGMLDGTYTPVVRFTDGTTNVAAISAKKVVKKGFHNLSEPAAERYLTEREADYERTASAQNISANSMTSACGYWVESMYWVGGGARASATDLEQIRATCALTIGKIEKSGSLVDNEQRYTVGRALSMIGATFRTLATQPEEKSDAVASARAMFKSNFGYAMDAVPVSRFPCVLSESNLTDCDTIMSRYAARLPEIARRNT